MNLKRHFGEALTLVLAAIACAVVANAIARSERKLPLFGTYPDATKVPAKKTAERDPSAPSQAGPAISSPVGSETPATSEVSSKVSAPAAGTTGGASQAGSGAAATSGGSSKVKGGGAAAPASLASAGGAAAPAKPPFSEKRPDPRDKPAGAAPEPAPAGEQKESRLSRFPPHPDTPSVEISGAEVAWLVARGVLVVDARRTKDYEAGHVPGARSISPWEGDADAKITALVNEARDGALPVVVYCSGGDCEDSHMLAQRLYGGGFNNLLVYKDGWPDWVARGGKAAAGPEAPR